MPLPDLGVGFIYLPAAGELLESAAGLTDVIEIEPQTLWLRRNGRYEPDRASIERLCALPQAKLVHGVGFPIGGVVAAEEEQVELYAELVRELGAPWASEHLAFNRTGELNAGFLLPPLQTRAGVDTAVDAIRAVSARLPVPFAIETGVNYLRPREGEMSDGAFVGEIATRADCGILLDLHNIWANERNGRQRVRDFLDEIPLDRVWEVHLAGGFEYDGYWLDAHSGAMPEELIGLAREVIPMLPNVHALIFEVLPPFLPRLGLDGLARQMKVLRELWKLRGSYSAGLRPAKGGGRLEAGAVPTPREWQDTLGALVIGRDHEGPLADELRADPAIDIFRKLVWQIRAGQIVDNFTFTARLLMLERGESFFREQLDRYFATCAPQFFGSAEAQAFAEFLAAQEIDVPYLDEVLAFERARLRAALDEEPCVIAMRHDPNALIDPLREGRVPVDIAEGEYEVIVQ